MDETPQQLQEEEPRQPRRHWRRVAVIAAAATALGLGLRLFVYESAVVVGKSMSPTLESGEYLLACKRGCIRRPLRRGEIITFHTPGAGRVVGIKRVIGLPGDWVQIWGTQVFVNGKRLGEPYLRASQAAAHPPVYVPAGSIYVLGDNRDNSEDSRLWGSIPLSSVRGMALFIYYPLRRAQSVR